MLSIKTQWFCILFHPKTEQFPKALKTSVIKALKKSNVDASAIDNLSIIIMQITHNSKLKVCNVRLIKAAHLKEEAKRNPIQLCLMNFILLKHCSVNMWKSLDHRQYFDCQWLWKYQRLTSVNHSITVASCLHEGKVLGMYKTCCTLNIQFSSC